MIKQKMIIFVLIILITRHITDIPIASIKKKQPLCQKIL